MQPQDNQDRERAAIAAAFAVSPSPTSAPPVFASMTEWAAWNFHTLAGEAVCDVGEWAMKRRNVGQFGPRKTARAFRAVLPAWLLPVFGACLVIPGPFDEGVAGIVALVMLAARFPRARSAWRGGKTERKAIAAAAAGEAG